ncbi:hypothetical protein C8Q73DRAFT_223710 [Cubamyces lactineus]|nr:hypothetical protein C8Q73DRAFT_223710 [Cubamyces lactineus]
MTVGTELGLMDVVCCGDVDVSAPPEWGSWVACGADQEGEHGLGHNIDIGGEDGMRRVRRPCEGQRLEDRPQGARRSREEREK